MMKSIFTFLSLISFQYSFGQTYHAFPDSNATWNQEQTVSWYQNGTYILERHYSGWRYTLGNDTIVNSIAYVKVGIQGLWSYETIDGNAILLHNDSLMPSEFFGGIREDANKKVWFINFVEFPPICYTYSSLFWPWAIDSEMLLYDFDLQVGQLLTYPHDRTVSAIDSIQLEDGSFRKRFMFSSNDYWIEGIGSSFGLFGAYKLFSNSDLSQCKIWMNCYLENGQYLFVNDPLPPGITCDSLNTPALTGIPPAYSSAGIFVPSSGTIQLAFDSYATNFKIINSLGQIIFQSDVQTSLVNLYISNYPPGLYYLIVNSSQNKITVIKVVKI